MTYAMTMTNSTAPVITEEYDLSAYSATEAKIEAAETSDTRESDTRWLAFLSIVTMLSALSLQLQFLYSTGIIPWLLQQLQSL